jgi:hypothetical protein
MFARSLARKALGNEEFCMQVDAHTKFREHWDTLSKREWKATNNEFAVLTHPPADFTLYEKYTDNGEEATVVPRVCKVLFQPIGFPVCVFFVIVSQKHAAPDKLSDA